MASVIIHLMIVLGISFVLPEYDDHQIIDPPLKITLVSHTSNLVPEDSEILAQSNSDGEQDATALLPVIVQLNEQTSKKKTQDIQQKDQFFDSAINESEIEVTDISKQLNSELPTVSRGQLTKDINFAYLNAQAQPKEKYVSARAKESIYAAYIERWRVMVERVGNLNYPEAARQQNIEGELVLDVAINYAGKIENVRVLRSSGWKILDDAAERIVHIAAPYDRFPDPIRKEIDIMHIVRTWEFNRDTLTSKVLETQ